MIEARLFAHRLLEALREDDPYWDITSRALPRRYCTGCIRFREDAVAAGITEAAELLRLLGLEFEVARGDGEYVRAGECVLYIRGLAGDVLTMERVILNIIMRASGVATATRKILERARRVNPRIRVAATRKTTPLLRYLEKRAVELGGGDPHRFSLSDSVLIKDNHIAVFGDLETAINAVKKTAPFTAKVEVEVSSVEDAIKAAELGVDIIMLDNVTPDIAKATHEELTKRGLRSRVILEASGGIGEDNVEEYAAYVDVVSIGALTHSVKSVDASMDVSC
jgi:nicotinate-nucleotide pyrophosphorylase (carboxylating)